MQNIAKAVAGEASGKAQNSHIALSEFARVKVPTRAPASSPIIPVKSLCWCLQTLMFFALLVKADWPFFPWTSSTKDSATRFQ